MLYGLYLSAAGMQAQELRQSVVSNNIANAETNGFKRDLAVMQSRLQASQEDVSMSQYAVPSLRKQGGGVYAVNSGMDLGQAPLKETKNSTDLALQGRGFFEVKGDAEGQKLLTRDGRFLIDANGGLIAAASGRAVLSSDGQPVVLNPSLPVMVDTDGTITQGDSAGVKLGMADVSNATDLVKLGDNVMTVAKPEMLKEVPATTQVQQYHVEMSGVDPVVEMVNMMENQRAFEANAKMISYQDTTLSELNTIGKVA